MTKLQELAAKYREAHRWQQRTEWAWRNIAMEINRGQRDEGTQRRYAEARSVDLAALAATAKVFVAIHEYLEGDGPI